MCKASFMAVPLTRDTSWEAHQGIIQRKPLTVGSVRKCWEITAPVSEPSRPQLNFEVLNHDPTKKTLQTVDVLVGDAIETVYVDPMFGPYAMYVDGSFSFNCSNAQGWQPYMKFTSKKEWHQMTPSEKPPLLIKVARKNASLRAWKGSDFFYKAMVDSGVMQPVVAILYSGGFTPAEGQELVQPLTVSLAKAGFKNVIVLHHPDAYGMTGTGRKPWKDYVSRLVQEIEGNYGTRKVIVFGHSRGAGLAMSLAVRLQDRCLKLYVTGAGPVKTGEPTGWEVISEAFRAQPNPKRAVVEWFVSLNPNAVLLSRLTQLPEKEFEEACTKSLTIKKMVDMFMVQYVDAMYPDPFSDIQVIHAPIMALALTLDPGSQPFDMRLWRTMSTSPNSSMKPFNASHMGCLQDEGGFIRALVEDMTSLKRTYESTGQATVELGPKARADLQPYVKNIYQDRAARLQH
eukprot:gnl/TRDRNA2_/TRDRNA2_144718_c0_seq1.p1 gnl/TRDRNA2_/TRDRNA2_144718_c0~~gnl/TRDRNA2_/TRDRNA2_144718_c0_seq1.p1  ORF type:complete len:457 (-),score=52.29 gnl/TRDRNA2_/TRDRNA2_144718_c0_seq1:33-1403(-)